MCGFNIIVFLLVLFGSLAVLFYFEADGINDFEIRYDNIRECVNNRGTGRECEVTFTLDTDLENPKIYYRLNNFYQNHRSFQKYSFAQLRGEDKIKISQCDPVTKNSDMLKDPEKWDISKFYSDYLKQEDQLDQEAWPCGFISKFAFSDSFNEIKTADGSFSVKIDDSDIAQSVDKDSRFKINDEKFDEGIYW